MLTKTDCELARLPWRVLAFVEDHLSNDDISSDNELFTHFVSSGLTRSQAERALSYRQAYLGNVFLSDETPIRIGRPGRDR
ncbi:MULTISPECIES: hypothetical protein [Lysobacter]|jgi:hypothetical protein|uniref:Uncharacterized protein n=2 Tax=Lysobacter gummosus TaxID=262324 RepID=A0ABY3XJS5_9GAMM|nr:MULTISPECIES: hypothetical protein [Lysobacter]UJB21474.1 hypothetical protein L1A79_10660 [Lysobacter capsici]UJQ29409.1 hypothetical protein L2D09_04205 [Lysobacter gummosus]UNP31876.1 hypothetical protein MOV92_11745 [Lysobacter gummosus]